jgi:hypothetical protein
MFRYSGRVIRGSMRGQGKYMKARNAPISGTIPERVMFQGNADVVREWLEKIGIDLSRDYHTHYVHGEGMKVWQKEVYDVSDSSSAG